MNGMAFHCYHAGCVVRLGAAAVLLPLWATLTALALGCGALQLWEIV